MTNELFSNNLTEIMTFMLFVFT